MVRRVEFNALFTHYLINLCKNIGQLEQLIGSGVCSKMVPLLDTNFVLHGT